MYLSILIKSNKVKSVYASAGVWCVWGGESGHGESVWSVTQNCTGSDQPASACHHIAAPAVPGCYSTCELFWWSLILTSGKVFQ